MTQFCGFDKKKKKELYGAALLHAALVICYNADSGSFPFFQFTTKNSRNEYLLKAKHFKKRKEKNDLRILFWTRWEKTDYSIKMSSRMVVQQVGEDRNFPLAQISTVYIHQCIPFYRQEHLPSFWVTKFSARDRQIVFVVFSALKDRGT